MQVFTKKMALITGLTVGLMALPVAHGPRSAASEALACLSPVPPLPSFRTAGRRPGRRTWRLHDHRNLNGSRVLARFLLDGLKLDHIPRRELPELDPPDLAVMKKVLAGLRLNETKPLAANQPVNRALHAVCPDGSPR